ncbi:hypothetical protein B0O80DRAFT_232883 [Mortierella sp. GBAus27b]|nr:hypothetical protein B0O80DRAFT_232883 [Mortierella sp. GBAus27b]
MMPMFGREHGNVIEINPFYIECTTPIYPHVETVPVWIYHNEVGTYSDKTYDFTNELAQSDLELLLRNVLPAGAEGMDAATYMSMMGRLSNAPSSTDISGQSGSNGSTMLHNSVMLKYQNGVDILIEEGIELDVEDDAGLTGNYQATGLLLYNQRRHENEQSLTTPTFSLLALDYAIFVNNVEITEALLRAGSVPSYERLATLPLATTSEMSALLKDLCDMDLPVSEDSAVAQESESGAAQLTSAVEASPEDEQVQDDAIDESLELADTVSETLGLNDGQPSQGSENTRVSQQRNPRPLSIATVSTVSTGMVSLAPTVSTMATSVASSTHQRARPSRPIQPDWQGRSGDHLSQRQEG